MRYILFTLFTFPFIANCCVCSRTEILERFNSADAVFKARILTIDSTTFIGQNSSTSKEVTLIQIQITEPFKGVAPEHEFLTLPIDFSGCHQEYTINKNYIFYVYKLANNPKIFSTNKCMGTKEVDWLETGELDSLKSWKNPALAGITRTPKVSNEASQDSSTEDELLTIVILISLLLNVLLGWKLIKK